MSACSKAAGAGMNLKALWVMMMQSHCAVAARARKRWRLSLDEIRLVGDENAGVRIEQQEFAAGLRQAMAGNDHHRLGDEAEPLLLHDGGGDGEGLSGADRMGDIGRAGADDAPDGALLVVVEFDDAARAGKLSDGLRRNGAARDC